VTRTPTNSRTATLTRTPTFTRTPTLTPSPTPTRPPGPEVTFFGIATADNHPRDPIAFSDDGVPIFDFPNQFGFIIVVEGRRGSSSGPPGILGTMDFPVQAPTRANLQIQAKRSLGNGSAAVCDRGPLPAPLGGVPGVDPPSFVNDDTITNAINDLACRFDVHMTAQTACTFDALGNFAFANPFTTIQYCSAPVVGSEVAFPSGDTEVTVRLTDGNIVGPERKLIVRVP
jgi:hypothetical protein